jgi:8-oxo-dGTP diphosphatase
MKRKLLIATSNPGKFKEMQEFFKTQPFEIVSLAEAGIAETLEESFESIEQNAYITAKFYAEKTGMLTLIEEGDSSDVAAVYDPTEKSYFASFDTGEDNKALVKIEYYLKKQYGARNIVVPCALVIQNGKMLMILRNDPHRPEYHRHWEFPGGGVEFREQMIPNVIRETEEETGLIVEPVKLLQHIATESQEFPTFAYQVYLVPYVCKVVGGTVNPRDEEALDAQWFELDDVTKYPLVGENARLFEKLLPELKEVIKEHNL